MRYNIWLVVFAILISCVQVHAQRSYSRGQYLKNEIKGGVGMEQGFNMGYNRYYNKNGNIGVGIGSHFPPKEHAHHTLFNIEHNSNFTLRRGDRFETSLLLNQQVMFWKYSEPEFTHKAVTFGLNTGFSFMGRSGFGLTLEIGPCITYTLTFESEPGSTVTPITNKVQSNFRLLFFQRF